MLIDKAEPCMTVSVKSLRQPLPALFDDSRYPA